MEATFDSTKLTREREVHAVCSMRKVITDMSSRQNKTKTDSRSYIGEGRGLNQKTPQKKILSEL